MSSFNNTPGTSIEGRQHSMSSRMSEISTSSNIRDCLKVHDYMHSPLSENTDIRLKATIHSPRDLIYRPSCSLTQVQHATIFLQDYISADIQTPRFGSGGPLCVPSLQISDEIEDGNFAKINMHSYRAMYEDATSEECHIKSSIKHRKIYSAVGPEKLQARQGLPIPTAKSDSTAASTLTYECKASMSWASVLCGEAHQTFTGVSASSSWTPSSLTLPVHGLDAGSAPRWRSLADKQTAEEAAGQSYAGRLMSGATPTALARKWRPAAAQDADGAAAERGAPVRRTGGGALAEARAPKRR